MINFDKPITTRCGCPVEIWTTKAKSGSGFPIRGEVFQGEKWESYSWTENGSFMASNSYHGIDLINSPEEIEMWTNIYPEKEPCQPLKNRGTLFESLMQAERFRQPGCVACIKVKFKKGDGL